MNLRKKWKALPLALALAALATTGAVASAKASKGGDPVRSAIEARGEEFRSCFERESLRENPDQPGSKKGSPTTQSVETHFLIDPSGKAVLVRVTRSVPPQPRVETCIVQLLKQLHFPKPPGGKPQEVSFPFYYGR